MKRAVLLLLATAASLVASQSVIDFSELPACAKQQCQILSQADANCVPPAAPVTNQGIYQSCVCESTLLTTLKQSGALCQTAGCSTEDANRISQYYIALCNGPVVEPEPTATTTTATTTTTGTETGTGTATADAAGSNGRVSTQKEQSWFAAHWKWVVMVIVIAIAMAVFWVGGIYLRRHFEKKRDAERANLAAKDAYTGGTPGNSSTTNTDGPPPEMSGGRNGSQIFPPAVAAAMPQRMRSRTNTLQSLRMNSSRTSLSQPVVWGPHQHQAYANARASNTSIGASVPPSPTSAIHSPADYSSRMRDSRPRDSLRYSMSQRLVNTANGHPGDATSMADPHGIARPHTASAGSHRHSSSGRGTPHLPTSSSNTIDRPHTAFGDPIRDVNRKALSTVQSDPGLDGHVEPQSAEICEASPQKPSQ